MVHLLERTREDAPPPPPKKQVKKKKERDEKLSVQMILELRLYSSVC